jgi:two-component system, LuxR family, sensor kinase FixL
LFDAVSTGLAQPPGRKAAEDQLIVNDTSTTGMRLWRQLTWPPRSWLIGAGYLALYLLLDWASYVEPLRSTNITPWNPNTGVVMALLLARGVRWAPLVALGILTGELLTDDVPAPWPVLAITSLYLATVYAFAAWALRRRGLDRRIDSPRSAMWFAGVTAASTCLAATGYVGILVSSGQVSADAAWASIGRYWIGEFNGIIALTPVLLLRVDRRAVWETIWRHKRELVPQALGAAAGIALVFALAAAHDVRLFYPLFVPVTWIALRYGVPGAMISVSLVQAALVAALELTPGSIPLFDVQFPLLSLGVTALLLGALATERDTTLRQLRQQDAALQRSMRFAVAGQLASALTHELNQPMTALVSYVRAAELMSESAGQADARLAGTLRKAGDEAGRAAAVLRRLREFYRGEGARLELIDPLEVCVRVANALRDRMRRGAVEFQMSGAGLPSVMVDRTQLEIVVHNLLTNSLDAFDAPAGGGGRPRRIEIAGEARDADVLIRVDDSGPGILPGLAERLFEPFVTSKISGMGLGLSLSRTFLRHQGGDLWSEPGRLGGASFVIRLARRLSPQTSL